MLLWKSMNIRKKMDSVPLHWTVWRDLYLQIGLAIFTIRRQSTGRSNVSGKTIMQKKILKAKKEKREPIIIPHFSCHHLRHTFCTRFCENETNIKVIQAVMGHANIETTMDIYAEVTDMKKTEAIGKIIT